MSNSQEQKKLYELPSDLIESFLSAHSFVGIEIDYQNDITILRDSTTKRYVKVPVQRMLNEEQIKQCIADAGLTLDDLDCYIEHLKAIRQLDSIIKQSLTRDSMK